MKDKWMFAAGVVLEVFAAVILIDIDSMFAFVFLFGASGAALIARAR